MPRKKNAPLKTEDPRAAINVLAIIAALEAHVLGKNEMSATQVSAALALLKKTLPDISDGAKKTAADPQGTFAHEDALRDLE